MTYVEENGNEFYQSLGKLFFSVAMADKKVRPAEVKRLKEDVKKYWLSVDDLEDGFGTDAAYQIEIVFDWLQQEEKNSWWCYGEFEDFYKNNPERFDQKIKGLIWKTADGIASSFSGKNKSELVLLAKLKMLLQGKGA
ncbi:hypothetical protein K8352_16395 [Flavobacteriaceae bacterium F89]|uniref:Uncharacterized protein n=1 Tax=Cerina litoralis TaxID=2874477 RepID=A0AAE3JSC7_9FLAO|nr:hypothetical protein [Cerina litoralis]MCG2462343.1 hypothetical protein [Cerina litoralis]